MTERSFYHGEDMFDDRFALMHPLWVGSHLLLHRFLHFLEG
jgi:hypothetical protein